MVKFLYKKTPPISLFRVDKGVKLIKELLKLGIKKNKA